ncbi:MAG: hypothetical protein U0165_05575 [Polyangiaceae bacterium]
MKHRWIVDHHVQLGALELSRGIGVHRCGQESLDSILGHQPKNRRITEVELGHAWHV